MENIAAMITYNKYVFLGKQADEEKKIVKVGFFYDRGEMLGGLLKGTKIDCSASAEEASSNCPVLRNTG
ncbi:hypothetical protein AB3S75_014200 [Citrus x aurantiifolia]